MFDDLIKEKRIKKYNQWDEGERAEKVLEYLKERWIEPDDMAEPKKLISELEKCIHFIKTSEVVTNV